MIGKIIKEDKIDPKKLTSSKYACIHYQQTETIELRNVKPKS